MDHQMCIRDRKNIEIVEQGVQSAADIPQAAASLAAKVDCINNFTDNNVVNNLNIVLEQANAAGIPVYGSEEEQVVNGCLASIGLDYIALGNVTGNMALEILNGADASSLAVKTITAVSYTHLKAVKSHCRSRTRAARYSGACMIVHDRGRFFFG